MKDKRAPLFELESLDGSMVNLNQFLGHKVYLTFNRWSSCPFCSITSNKIIVRSKLLESKGIKTVMIFPSKPSEIKKYLPRKLDLRDTTFLSNPSLDIYDSYNTRASLKGEINTLMNFEVVKESLKHLSLRSLMFQGKLFQLPSGFLINEKGVIELAKHGNDLTDVLQPEEILEFAQNQ